MNESTTFFRALMSYTACAHTTKVRVSREEMLRLSTAAARQRTVRNANMSRSTHPGLRGLAAIVALLILVALAASPALADEGPGPLRVTAHFLDLTPEQVQQVITIRTAAAELAAPILEQIAGRSAALAELVRGDDPNPTEVGALVLSIHALKAQVGALQQEAAAEIRGLLDATQLQRLEAAARSAPLCRVIPSLAALHLI